MNSPSNSILCEACELILAQIDTLESPETLTLELIHEFQCRSEKITVLCEQLDQMEVSAAEEQLLESLELLESVA